MKSKSILEAIIAHRFAALFGFHAILFSMAYYSAFLLRFDFSIPQEWKASLWVTLPWIVAVKLALFYGTGQLHGWWRIITFQDCVSLALAFSGSFVVLSLSDLIVDSVRIPRSIIVLDTVVGLIFVGALRSSWRLIDEYIRPNVAKNRFRSAVLVGTDDESVLLASQLQSYGRMRLRMLGLISVSPLAQKQIRNLPILGSLAETERLFRTHGFELILVQAGQLPGNLLRKLIDQARRLEIELQIIPSHENRLVGKAVVPVREINIDDLLRRDPVTLDKSAVRSAVDGKVVLVTGAGGSIGSEICRQLVQFRPSKLLLLGRGENRIFAIDQELKRLVPHIILETLIADIRNVRQINAIFDSHRPDLVFHAAAHKHVPLMEANVREAIDNNVHGTRVVADAAEAYGVSRFVLISSDKAVRPSSIMGATKRVAEQYIQVLGRSSQTKFMTVRFGNVLGSAGSVVPHFSEQIRRGGPITITDERMTRFFMTIPEASQLVLQAGVLGNGGDLFVLDMGTPIRIVDLARDLIRLAGLPSNAIEIVVTGCRPGEKLHEELADDDGDLIRTSHPKILSVRMPHIDENAFYCKLESLLSEEISTEEARDILIYEVKETVSNLNEAESRAMHAAGR